MALGGIQCADIAEDYMVYTFDGHLYSCIASLNRYNTTTNRLSGML